MAYKLGNSSRTLASQHAVEHWLLARLGEKMIKIGATIMRHGRNITFQMAELALSCDLFADILRRIDRLKPPPLPT